MEKKQVLDQFLVDTIQSFDCHHHVGGSVAADDNHRLIVQFYSAWIHLASDVLTECDVSVESTIARLQNFAEVLNNNDLADILNICLDAADLLIGISCTSYGDFKGTLARQHPDQEMVIKGLLSPINPLLLRFSSRLILKL